MPEYYSPYMNLLSHPSKPENTYHAFVDAQDARGSSARAAAMIGNARAGPAAVRQTLRLLLTVKPAVSSAVPTPSCPSTG